MQTIAVDRDLFRRLVLLLDAALPALDRAAEAERRREAGKALREITEQKRAAAARDVVSAASAALDAVTRAGDRSA